jgi:23S rRNA (adenine2503-C2)-methyltransferase
MTIEILAEHGKDDVATVFIGRTATGKLVEFAETFQPYLPIEKKWVIILSVMHGCPVGCLMCDAGTTFESNLSKEEIIDQLDYILTRKFPNKKIPVEKLKVQFTRMGEPSFNDAVIDVLEELPKRYEAPGLLPCVSTIAPAGRKEFFERLFDVKDGHYKSGRFQLQFSIHTTDSTKRDELMPIKKLSFDEIAAYGEQFFKKGDRKITLNFALMDGYPIDPHILARHFRPEKFLVKITPLNPTTKARENNLKSVLGNGSNDNDNVNALVNQLTYLDFEVILSIGNTEENAIGSNCGQFISRQNRYANYNSQDEV